jgi:SAM-dependent methyltransferase
MAGTRIDWQKAYEDNHTPWDLRGATGPLLRLVGDGFFEDLGLAAGAAVAVPMCGRGHDLAVLGRLGLGVFGFDIAPAAAAEAAALLDLNGVPATVLIRDVLGLAHEFPERFGLVYDYTSFCALPPTLRGAYAAEMAAILAPGASLLMLAFPLRAEVAGAPGRPPFLVTEADLSAAFDPHFELAAQFAAGDSAVERRGAERWFHYRKRR